MMATSVTMTCFLAISLCSAKGTYTVCEDRKKKKGKHLPGEIQSIIKDLLEGEGIRLQNKCNTSVLKTIGIIEDHTHLLHDDTYMGRGW